MLSRTKPGCPARRTRVPARKHRCGPPRSNLAAIQSVLWGKMVRLRDKDHRRFVLRQACLVCGRVPSDPHHLTFTQPRALARRASDEFIVPVCRVHHRDLHRSGNEAAWWRKLNIDPLPVALRLWQHTRSDREIAPMTQAVKTPDASTHDQARPDAGTELEPAAQGAAPAGASESGDHGAGS